ncbi:unnamed protein product [Polarella glacialis]|uniref:Uncharacterized protein n=1 Tax=Polarella glacialis TaxID=89957 RepID=A0A813JFR2_POLGL|nr:unnamed protein product [Polarella glacialis]
MDVGLQGALRASAYVAAIGAQMLGRTCLHTWCIEAREVRQLVARSALQARLRLGANFLWHATTEAAAQLAMVRWLALVQQRRRGEVAEEERLKSLRLEKQLSVSKERQKRWQLRLGSRFAERFDLPLLWTSLMTWAMTARKASEERAKAAEFIRRQHLNYAEEALINKQVILRPLVLNKIDQVCDAFVAKALPEVFSAWRWHAHGRCLAYKTLLYQESRERRDLLALAVEAWKGAAIRCWLRAAAWKVGQAVVRYGDQGVLRRLLLSWRASCFELHGENEAKRLLAAHSLAQLCCRPVRKALGYWQQQARKATPLRRGARGNIDIVGLADKLQCNGSVPTERLSLAVAALQAWKMGSMLSTFERRRAREERSGDRVPFVSKRALERAAEQGDRRSMAVRRFARWYSLSQEEPCAGIAKCFAAWTLAVLEANTELCAAGLTRRALSLSHHFREAAEQLLGRSFRFSRQLLLGRSWLALAAHLQRGRQRVTVSRLCAGVGVLDDGFAARRILWSWRNLLSDGQRVREESQRKGFKLQASRLARRLVRLNRCTYGFLTAAGALVAWRSVSQRRGRRVQLRHSARWAALLAVSVECRRCRDIFVRWTRAAFAAKQSLALSPLGFVFVAWKVWLRGASTSDRRFDRAVKFTSVDQADHVSLVWANQELAEEEQEMAGRSDLGLSAAPEGARAGWQRWLRHAVCEKRLHRNFRLRTFVETTLTLRHQRQALCFAAWAAACAATKKRRRMDAVLGRQPLSRHGLHRLLLHVTFSAWAMRLETAQLAKFRRSGLKESLICCLASRTLAASFKEIRLRLALLAWTRCVGTSKAEAFGPSW